MATRFSQEVRREADRHIRRHEERLRALADERNRRNRRSATPPTSLTIDPPTRWSLNPGFNPYLVRSRSDRIGYSIKQKLIDRTYNPCRPIQYQIPKKGGGSRAISVFQIADSAVSRVIYESLLAKNLPIMGPRSYAYRKDVSAQDAVQYVRSSFQGRQRVFVAEYDFRKFFDNISHEHIWRCLSDNRFLLTSVEKHVIRSFLEVTPSSNEAYESTGGPQRQVGVPQGTSVSLFLANVAAWELDRELEQLGVCFTRYADDTLIWSSDYSNVCRATEAIYNHSRRMGVDVNLEKSPGISLLMSEGSLAQSEMTSKSSIDYLGYRIFLDRASIKVESVEKIKAHICDLLYRNLIAEPKRHNQSPGRVEGTNDNDYITFIWQVRRYLYGDLSELAVQRFQRSDAPIRRFKGVMSGYPLIDDSPELRELDRWLVRAIWLALRRRRRLLEEAGLPVPAVPHSATFQTLAGLTSTSDRSGEPVDLRIPSFHRIASVVRRAGESYGASVVGQNMPTSLERTRLDEPVNHLE